MGSGTGAGATVPVRSMFDSITTSVGPPISSRCSTSSRRTSTSRRRPSTLAALITARRGWRPRGPLNRRIRYPPTPSIASATTKAIRNFTGTDRSSKNSIEVLPSLRDATVSTSHPAGRASAHRSTPAPTLRSRVSVGPAEAGAREQSRVIDARRTMSWEPLCLISCSRLGPAGGLAARIGMPDSMKPFGALNHGFNYQVVAGDNRGISAYRDQA